MSNRFRPLAAACLAALAFAATPSVHAATTTDADAAASPWLVDWNVRIRHEQVDSDAFARDAKADTARLRLGLRLQLDNGLRAYLQGNGVAAAGDDYNSGANGRTRYPVIADPQTAEVSQAWLGWQGSTLGVAVGRQALVFDNQRWVNDAAWRQHPQTFDAVSAVWQPASDWTVRYAWLDRVHRAATHKALSPLARERRLDTHLVNVKYTHARQAWVGYSYLNKDRDVPTASSATWGARWTGKPAGDGFGWQLEAARQTDYANNPLRFTHNYWLIEPAWTLSGVTARLGWEHLGGDGHTALQTPLTSPHVFNGWDNQFTSTPAGGLNDRYVALGGKLPAAAELAWNVAWHDFHAVRGGRYGSEWDASVGRPLGRGVTALAKVARYQADGFGRDDTKFWLQLEWSGTQALD
ncbi:MAG TPA: alginate export family protein [Rhodanobacter sp.]|nr:alginate export family protein [Rhodanobacter sp.]